jgi:hypothetical protein
MVLPARKMGGKLSPVLLVIAITRTRYPVPAGTVTSMLIEAVPGVTGSHFWIADVPSLSTTAQSLLAAAGIPDTAIESVSPDTAAWHSTTASHNLWSM